MPQRVPLVTVTIRDCVVDTFRCGGHGGQNVNKRDTGVRVTHPPSGASAESCETRSQGRNKTLAFGRMVRSEKFQLWLKIETSRRMTGRSIDDIVNEQMNEANIRVEVRGADGKWAEPTEKE